MQYHPELKSRPLDPHPLFASFIGAAVEQSRLCAAEASVLVRVEEGRYADAGCKPFLEVTRLASMLR